MVMTTFSFVIVTGIIRYLGSNLPAAESAFIRYAFGCLIMFPVFWKMLRDPPPTSLFWLEGIRGLAHAMGVMLWFYAMARIPIAQVTAIGYVTPIFVTVGAAIFLGERFRLQRIMGVIAGLIGALIIIRPGFIEITTGQLAQLTAAPLFAASFLMAKSMSGKSSPQLIVAMLTIFCTLFLLPPALMEWQTPNSKELMWLFITAIVATFGHYSMTKALAAAPISVTQPITFLQLIWATALGGLMFNEPLDPFVILGGAIIVGAATFISYRESKVAKKQITPPASATKS